MLFKKLFIVLIILCQFILLTTFANAGHIVDSGNKNSKIHFNKIRCSADVSGFFKNILSKQHYNDGLTYAGVTNSGKINFHYDYPANNGNDAYKIKVYVSDKNENPVTSFLEFTPLDSGGSHFSTSSKDYAGKYFMAIKMTDKTNANKYCFFYNKVTLIEISKKNNVSNPSISSLNKTNFDATDATQDLRIYGSNFTNGTRVYIDYGSGWKLQSSSYTHIINSAEIKFDLKTTKNGSGTWKVKVKNSDGYSGYKTFTVSKAIQKPSISSLNKTTFEATDSTQDLRIYGSNFTNNTVVYIDYGSGWKSQSSSYTHIINSGEIKFDLRTTKNGSGTWKVKVKNSDGYSDYKTFDVKKTITKPSTPTLKSPSNNATLNGTTQTLDWYSVSGATGYELALRDATLNRWIYGGSKSTKKTTNSEATVSGLTEGHKYAWTVQAKNSAGLSNDSSVRYFTIKKIITKPSTPTLKSPSNNSTLNGTTQTLSWYSVSGAEKYEIYLRDETTNSWIFSDSGEKKVTGTSVSYSGFKEGHTYVWNLKALNSAGYSELSLTRRFTIKDSIPTDETPPELSTSINSDNNEINATLIYITKPASSYYHDYTIYKNGVKINSPKGVRTLLSGNFVSWNKINISFLSNGDYEIVFEVYSSNDKNKLLTTIKKNFSISRTPTEDTEKPTVTILEAENDISHTGNLLKILTKVTDNKALKYLHVSFNGITKKVNISGTSITDYVGVDISSVPKGRQRVTIQAEDTSGNLSDKKTYHYVRGTDEPTVHTVIQSVSPSSASSKIYSEVTFNATLDKKLSSNEKITIVLEGNAHEYPMECSNSTECTFSKKIEKAGIDRKFTCYLYSDGEIVSQKLGVYTITSDLAIESLNPSQLDPNRQNRTIIITGSGFTKNSQIYRKQPTRDWHQVHTIYQDSTHLKMTLIPTPEKKGKWYFYVNDNGKVSNKDKYINVNYNEKPIINKYNAYTPLIAPNEEFSISLKAYDTDGDVKSIRVDWGDGTFSNVDSSNNSFKELKHKYSTYGIYEWKAVAIDNDGGESLSPAKNSVNVYDPEYTKTPEITSDLKSINGNSFLKATGGQMLVIRGKNFSTLSTINYIDNNGNRGEVLNDNSCILGVGKCIKYKSSNELWVNLAFYNSQVGTWKFAVQNKDNVSNYKSIQIKTTIKPKFTSANNVQYVMVSGETLPIPLTVDGYKVKSIKLYVDSAYYSQRKVVNNKVSFTYTAPTVSQKVTKTLIFKAIDEAGQVATRTMVVNILPDQNAKKTFINKPNIAKVGECGGATVIKVNNSVNTATGAEMFTMPLLKVQGLHSIAFILNYNSLLLTQKEIAKGWSHNFGVSSWLDFIGEDKNKIRVHWNDGGYNDFERTPDHNFTSTDYFTRHDTIAENSDGTYTVKKAQRVEFVYFANGRLKEIKNYLNQKISIYFDVDGKLSKVKDDTSGVSLLYSYNDNGKLQKVTDPQLNREVTLEYDDNNQLVTIKAPAGQIYSFEYNERGQMTRYINPDGTTHFQNTYLDNGLVATEDDGREDNELFHYTFDRSEQGKVKTTFTDGEGKSTQFIYSDTDFLLYEVIDANNNKTRNEYNAKRELIKSINAKNQSTKYEYDDKGHLIKTTMPNGLIIQNLYDARGNIVEERVVQTDGTTLSTKYVYNTNNTLKSKTLPNGDTTRYEYNSDKQLIKSYSPSNQVTTYEYEKGRVSKVTYPKGNYVTYEYDEAGRLIRETIMPLNATTHYTYDDADRVTKVTDAMNHEVFVSYNQKGQKISTTDAMGNVTYYRYDGNGNLLKTIYPDNTETTYEYDGEDRVKTITYANGATNKFEYDALGRVTKQIDAMGNFVEFKYDVLGNVLQKLDVDGNLIAKYTYDTMQKVVEAVDYFNNKVTNKYNQLGMLEQTTDPLSRVNKFKYDKLGRLTEAVDALNGISKQSFDKEGNTKDFTDPNSNKTELKHDEVGNLTEIKTASNSTTKYSYDSNGLLKKETNARGQERKYSYNKNGQVESIVDEVGTVSYTYDENGNTKTITQNGKTITMLYNEMNRLTSYRDQEGNTIAYDYDAVGNLKTLTYPDGKTVEYSYNLANQLTRVKDWHNNVTTYEYDNHGRMVKQTYPNGAVLTRTYDNGGRLTSQKEFLSQYNRISEYAYEYDKVGNILKERTYPQISPKALATLQMSYAKGNLLKEANQTVPTFDKDDNMLRFGSLALGYDSRNRLTKANGVSYVYDAQNNRLSKTVDSKKTSYITNPNAPLSQVLVKTDADGSKTYYVYGLGLLSQTKGSETLYYHYDLRGSTIALSDDTKDYPTIADRFSYAPYGKLLTHTGSHATPFLFVGKHGVMQEENELVYMRARYYHENLRRFVNRDTLLGEVGDFGSLNRFGYVNGKIINNIDPLGEEGGPFTSPIHLWIYGVVTTAKGCIYTGKKVIQAGKITYKYGKKAYRASKKEFNKVKKLLEKKYAKSSGVYVISFNNGKEVYIGKGKADRFLKSLMEKSSSGNRSLDLSATKTYWIPLASNRGAFRAEQAIMNKYIYVKKYKFRDKNPNSKNILINKIYSPGRKYKANNGRTLP